MGFADKVDDEEFREGMEKIVEEYYKMKNQFLMNHLYEALPDEVYEVICKHLGDDNKQAIKRQLENYDIFVAESNPGSMQDYNTLMLCKGKQPDFGENIREKDDVEIVAEMQFTMVHDDDS